jgi:GNAT superfamily N-acetyltransferase
LIVDFDPQRATPHEWSRYHTFRKIRHAEHEPEDPYPPDDVLEDLWRREDPFEEVRRRLFVKDGQVVAEMGINRTLPRSPEYESWKHIVWIRAAVLTAHRRQGIARAFLPGLLEIAEEVGATVLGAGTDEASGHAFLRWLGATSRFTGADNRLDLEAVDWSMVREWVAEAERRSPGVRLELHEPHVPETVIEDWCRAYTEMLNTVPFEDMEHGTIAVTPETMGERYARLDLVRGVHHVLLAREPDGAITGLTEMEYVPHAPGFIDQELTAVLPAARGRGLGKWLKGAMLLHVREVYADLRWVRTGNAGSNAPMLAINHQLGFKKHREGAGYQIGRDELAARVREVASTGGPAPSAGATHSE